MLLIWSGRGILSIVVFFVIFILCALILPKGSADYGISASLFIAGVFSWVYGNKWNADDDNETNNQDREKKLTRKKTLLILDTNAICGYYFLCIRCYRIISKLYDYRTCNFNATYSCNHSFSLLQKSIAISNNSHVY